MDYQSVTPRRSRFLRLIDDRDTWSIKLYSIVYGDAEFDSARFDAGIRKAISALPTAAPENGCPGVGFMILHQGNTGDYVVMCWWDRENELPVSVLLRDGTKWRPARDGESFCVWDLEIIWRERNSYVATMLSGAPGDPAAYLEAVA